MENPVANPINISIEHFWNLLSSIDVMQSLQVLFLILFTLVLFVTFAKGAKSINLSELFKSEITNTVSHTKFWGNIAYFAATISFLTANLLYFKEFQQNIEMIWLIYLTVVSGNNVANKWIMYKYDKQNYTGTTGESQPPAT